MSSFPITDKEVMKNLVCVISHMCECLRLVSLEAEILVDSRVRDLLGEHSQEKPKKAREAELGRGRSKARMWFQVESRFSLPTGSSEA